MRSPVQFLRGMLLATLPTVAMATLAAPTPSLQSTCSGCQGSGTSTGINTIPGCGTVKVEVTVSPGACREIIVPGEPGTECVIETDCGVSIKRWWTDIPSGSIVTGCVIQNGLRYCIDPPLSSSGGSGSHGPIEYIIECGSGFFQWSTVAVCASAPGGRLTALAAGFCGACPG